MLAEKGSAAGGLDVTGAGGGGHRLQLGRAAGEGGIGPGLRVESGQVWAKPGAGRQSELRGRGTGKWEVLGNDLQSRRQTIWG